jgi:hypothetical protein
MKIHSFDIDFCKNIIESLPTMKRFIAQYENEKVNIEFGVEIEKNQPTDAEGWRPLPDDENIKYIKSILKNNIKNVKDAYCVIQRLDSNKKSTPHRDSYDYTGVILLNDNFSGGDLIVDGKNSDLKVGDFFVFPSQKLHYVQKINSGQRYTLITFIKKENKNNKTLI